MIAPRTPNSVPNAVRASSVTSGRMPSVRFITRGPKTLASSWWMISEAMTVQRAVRGDSDRATTIAGKTPIRGPMRGTSSMTATRRANTKAKGRPMIR